MLKQRRGLSVAMIVAWAVAGCASGPKLARAASGPPSWFVQPPADDAQSWYGTGEGSDLEEARRNGLRFVGLKLGSTVKGQISNSTVVTSNGGKEKVDIEALSSVTEQLAETNFTKSEVARSEKGGRGVYALVKVDKPAFIADLRRELQSLEKPLREAETALPSQPPLERFLSLRRLKKEIDDGTRLSLQLLGAGSAEEGGAGWARYVGLRQMRDKAASELTFELRAAPADADVAKLIASFLADNGMRTSAAPMAGANPLTISTEGREADIDGNKMVKLKVRVAVLDSKGRAAGTREYELSGTSRFDFKGARENGLAKLKPILQKAGPVSGLGFPG